MFIEENLKSPNKQKRQRSLTIILASIDAHYQHSGIFTFRFFSNLYTCKNIFDSIALKVMFSKCLFHVIILRRFKKGNSRDVAQGEGANGRESVAITKI